MSSQIETYNVVRMVKKISRNYEDLYRKGNEVNDDKVL